jgi:hypothetical protein
MCVKRIALMWSRMQPLDRLCAIAFMGRYREGLLWESPPPIVTLRIVKPPRVSHETDRLRDNAAHD